MTHSNGKGGIHDDTNGMDQDIDIDDGQQIDIDDEQQIPNVVTSFPTSMPSIPSNMPNVEAPPDEVTNSNFTFGPTVDGVGGDGKEEDQEEREENDGDVDMMGG